MSSLPLNVPEYPAFNREKFEHSIKVLLENVAYDDIYYLNTQSGTQWDGFRHVSAVETFWTPLSNANDTLISVRLYTYTAILQWRMTSLVLTCREPCSQASRPLVRMSSDPMPITNVASTIGQSMVSQVAGFFLISAPMHINTISPTIRPNHTLSLMRSLSPVDVPSTLIFDQPRWVATSRSVISYLFARDLWNHTTATLQKRTEL